MSDECLRFGDDVDEGYYLEMDLPGPEEPWYASGVVCELCAGRIEEVLDEEERPELVADGGRPDADTEHGLGRVELHTNIGKPGVIVELRPNDHDTPWESDMSHLSDEDARELRDRLNEYLDDAEETDEYYECPDPDCDAELDVLYERREMKIPCVTGWCPDCGIAKAVPIKEVDDGR